MTALILMAACASQAPAPPPAAVPVPKVAAAPAAPATPAVAQAAADCAECAAAQQKLTGPFGGFFAGLTFQPVRQTYTAVQEVRFRAVERYRVGDGPIRRLFRSFRNG